MSLTDSNIWDVVSTQLNNIQHCLCLFFKAAKLHIVASKKALWGTAILVPVLSRS